mgnify:CR=1 FL=1
MGSIADINRTFETASGNFYSLDKRLAYLDGDPATVS